MMSGKGLFVLLALAAMPAILSRWAPQVSERDLIMSRARKQLDWNKQKEYALDPNRFTQMRNKAGTAARLAVCAAITAP
jgi:thiamine biosynthesis protein ThiC